MLLAPSPKYASRRPSRRPLRSAIVCRSASTWHGWNSSDSALITGTVAASTPSRSACPARYVRHDDRVDVAGQHPSGVLPASRRDPTGCCVRRRRQRARRVGRCRARRRTGCGWSSCRRSPRHRGGPSSGRWLNGSFFNSAASSSTLGLFIGASGRRRAGSASGHVRAPLAPCPGRRATRSGIVELSLGDDQRRRQPDDVRGGGVDQESGVPGEALRPAWPPAQSTRHRTTGPCPEHGRPADDAAIRCHG